jgi:nucleoside-diphosphate-sugar epimerase
LLNRNYNVTAIYHSTPLEISHKNLTTVQCDVLDPISLEEIMRNITHVYHCAALISYERKDRSALLKTNVEGTANVANACLANGVQKLVHVSSVAALGRNSHHEMINEKMHWNEETSNSVYGKSKYYGEMEVWRAISEGLNAVVINPSIILGGNSWNTGSSAIFKSVYNNFDWYSEGVTGFVDVRDVAGVMILLMNSEISGQRFILNGANLSYKDVFYLIAKYFHKKPPSKKVTPFLSEIMWRWEAFKRIFTGKKSLVTRETARMAQAVVRFDNSKILKALPGFVFTPVEDTIAHTCNSLKEKYSL